MTRKLTTARKLSDNHKQLVVISHSNKIQVDGQDLLVTAWNVVYKKEKSRNNMYAKKSPKTEIFLLPFVPKKEKEKKKKLDFLFKPQSVGEWQHTKVKSFFIIIYFWRFHWQYGSATIICLDWHLMWLEN